jgi:hypothetical protein
MPDNTATPATERVELDAEGRQLQLQAEKVKYVEAIAKSQQAATQAKTPSLSSLLPTVADAPKGEVTVGDRAGALGVWRAHRIIDEVAKKIANEAEAKTPMKTDAYTPRLLVVDDRSLLQGDWTARQVTSTLVRLDRRVKGLNTRLDTVFKDLVEGISNYEKEEQEEATVKYPETQPADRDGTRGGWQREPTTPTGTVAQSTTVGATPVGVAGALGGAVDLLGLLRTDYTLTAGSVSATPAELVTLTAAHLAALGVTVEADLFSTVPASASARKFSEVVEARDDLAQELARLQQALAPVEAELAAINARIDPVEKEWATAAADTNGDKTADVLRTAGDRLARQAQRRERLAGPARTFIAYAVKVLTEVDTSIASLMQVPESGHAPLFTAARRERLDGTNATKHPITHVLYVNLDALAADTVTRRSILGASGVVRFLSTGNASWLLLEAATGAVIAGGQQQLADLITLGLSTGQAKYDDVPAGLSSVANNKEISDPLARLEWPARAFVATLAVVLAVVGILSIVAVIKLTLS